MSARRILSITSAAAIAACYGAGPAPQPPDGVTVVYVAASDHTCTGSTYVGPVAFGSDAGYAVALPYTPTATCASVTSNVAVTSFALDGTTPKGVAIAQGQSGMLSASSFGITEPEPLLTARGSSVAFVYSAGGQPTVGPAQSAITMFTGSDTFPTFIQPSAIALDDAALYLAIPSQTPSPLDPFSPQYPCCSQLPAAAGAAQVWTLPWPPQASAPATVAWLADASLWCGELEHCIVESSTKLFHVAASGISSIAKTGGAVSVVAPIPPDVPAGAVPVGLAADDAHVVVAFANPPSASGAIPPGCWIVEATGGLIFESTELSCLGAALDADHVYVALVQADGNGALHGDGVARVVLSGSHDVESVAFAIAGAQAGPRRVYIVAGTLFVVDPFAIAAIAPDALAGKHELTP